MRFGLGIYTSHHATHFSVAYYGMFTLSVAKLHPVSHYLECVIGHTKHTCSMRNKCVYLYVHDISIDPSALWDSFNIDALWEISFFLS